MKTILLPLAALALPATALAQSVSGPELNNSADRSQSNSLSVTLPDGITSSMLGKRDAQMIAVQTMLDRSRHSPGVVDGYNGENTRRAISAYRRANGIGSGGSIDGDLLRSLLETQGGDVFQTYTITSDDLNRSFTDVPADFEAKAELDSLGYESAQEMLAERFHMDADFLAAMNPGVDFSRAGQTINVIAKGDETLNADVARIEVRKNENSVVAMNSAGEMVASYPATIGSGEFPSPSGNMTVAAIAPAPKYYFSPEGREWGPDRKLTIAAGPNNPVGGTWIDLSKEGYGIHGSPDPKMVGKRNSHGCVRLTNWDAEELAKAVSQGVTVVFT
ncbi:L,D-transpeptidase family protein [Altererythrobacter sp. SALINAS58]|uniref:L,D-transpeptidase n=1 Tax=Alteripontixanthobacter muriae TaxID=2705546 RepID=UPI001576AA2B|nr:L,D-transpeptidase [Alteripontixanthobacter muriae]NTZ42464.1 L,D-transpeptidase family protein [Alteripontixanthobacter muriae]